MSVKVPPIFLAAKGLAFPSSHLEWGQNLWQLNSTFWQYPNKSHSQKNTPLEDRDYIHLILHCFGPQHLLQGPAYSRHSLNNQIHRQINAWKIQAILTHILVFIIFFLKIQTGWYQANLLNPDFLGYICGCSSNMILTNNNCTIFGTSYVPSGSSFCISGSKPGALYKIERINKMRVLYKAHMLCNPILLVCKSTWTSKGWLLTPGSWLGVRWWALPLVFPRLSRRGRHSECQP